MNEPAVIVHSQGAVYDMPLVLGWLPGFIAVIPLQNLGLDIIALVPESGGAWVVPSSQNAFIAGFAMAMARPRPGNASQRPPGRSRPDDRGIFTQTPGPVIIAWIWG